MATKEYRDSHKKEISEYNKMYRLKYPEKKIRNIKYSILNKDKIKKEKKLKSQINTSYLSDKIIVLCHGCHMTQHRKYNYDSIMSEIKRGG
jgi:hypothetical protein